MPAALMQLLSFLEQTPGSTLKVSPDRQAEITALLVNSGFSQKQVEQLLNSPEVQQNGLTAEDLKSCWLKSLNSAQPEGLASAAKQPGQNAPQDSKLSQLISDPEYQRQWSRLTVPASAWGQLRLELQRLGIKPEVVAALEDQASTKGLSLQQVWQVIKQNTGTGAGAGAGKEVNGSQTQADGSVTGPPSFQGAAQELEGWRQILVQAGFNPQVAQALLGSQEPGNTEALKERLLQVAPATPAPEALDAPKPLYLPDNLRLRVLALEQKDPSSQQQSGEKGQSQTNPETSGKIPNLTPPQGLETGSKEMLLPPLSGGSSVPLHVPGGAGASSLVTESPYAYLNPEMRQAMWSQLQEGILSNLSPGETQVKLSLQPPELGQVLLTLNVKDNFVEVTAATTRPEVAQMATAEIQQLVQSLSQQGLILTQFQMQVQDGGDRPVLALSGQKQAGKKDGESKDKDVTEKSSQIGQVDCFA